MTALNELRQDTTQDRTAIGGQAEPRIGEKVEKRVQEQLRAGKGIIKVTREVGVDAIKVFTGGRQDKLNPTQASSQTYAQSAQYFYA